MTLIPQKGKPKYEVGDWLADDRCTYRPEFGRVKEVMWDQFEGCWCVCLTMYSPKGTKGRFEPMLNEANWHLIERPQFPLSDGRYDDWASELNYIKG